MNILKHKKTFLVISSILVAISVVFVLVFGLKLGLDFTGGARFTYSVDTSGTTIEDAKDLINSEFSENSLEIKNITVNENTIVITTPPVDSNTSNLINDNIQSSNITLDSFDSIGSVIGSETVNKSVTALFVALLGMLIYIAYAFRNIPKPYSSYKFGVSALIAMVHDVLIVLGVFAYLGKTLGVELDILFITALLTIIGFSVNDTIVVFDRVRENLIKRRGGNLEEIVNTSINETLRRSIGTSFTVLIVLLSMFIFGGESIKYFILAFIVGVVVGTYSSIFIAAPTFVIWETYTKTSNKKPQSKKKKKR